MLIFIAITPVHSQQTVNVTDNIVTLQNLQNQWCSNSLVEDRRLNESQKFKLRVQRQSLFGDQVNSVFAYYQQSNVNNFIQSMRWPTALLIVMIILSLFSWFVYLGFCCVSKSSDGNDVISKICIASSWILFVLFIGLFIVIMIFIGISEVSQRRSKCQLLNVGNILVNGYVNNQNGNNYVGMVAISNALQNLQAEFQNLGPAAPSAQSILVSNLNFLPKQAANSLLNIYLNNAGNVTVGPFRETSQGNFISNLKETITPAIGDEYNRLAGVTNALLGAAQAVVDFSNTNNNQIVTQTINQMNVAVQSLLTDVSSSALGLWNVAWTRYQYATGGYWAIFALSIAIIIIVSVMLACLHISWNQNKQDKKRILYNIILGLLGFFVIWYGVCIIILLAGSTSIATYCSVLGQLNQGNTFLIDNLPITWQPNPQGNTKQILKQCLVGNNGDILNFVTAISPLNSLNVTSVIDVQQIIQGLLGYKAWSVSPIPANSPSISVYAATLAAIGQGVIEDSNSVFDQNNIINNLIAGSGLTNSMSSALCNLNTSFIATCVAEDRVNSNVAYSGNANYTNILPYYQNLQAYILSEQTAVASLINQLLVGSNSPNSLFNLINQYLAANQNNYNNIISLLPKTFGSFQAYTTGLYSLDCRNIRVEMNILEDHVCFRLNYAVFILTVITAVSFMLLFFLMWTLFVSSRMSNSSGVVATLPNNVIKEDPALDINDREIIPSM